jgi:hypothetical protein
MALLARADTCLRRAAHRASDCPMALGSRSSAGWLALLALWGLAGCAHRARSAMYLPCKVKEITVSEEVYTATEDTWVATCKGHDYGCWASADGNKVRYGCKAMRQSARRARTADAGS